MAAEVINFAVNLASTLVLARRLGPDEFGLIAVAISIQALLAILRDAGFANALIQKKEINDLDRNSVLWVGTVSALALVGLLALAAPVVANFYARPQLRAILWVLTFPILAQAVSSVQEAQFRRELQFGRLVFLECLSNVIASAAAIWAVLLGAGVWGLVIRTAGVPILLAVGCWGLSRWRPGLQFSSASLRSLWAFGGYFLLSALLGYGMSRLDSPIIGKLLGVGAAGLFFMARNLALTALQNAVNAVGRVLFPAFSALQDDPAAIRSGFLMATRCLAILVFPVVAFIVAISPEAVPMILGDPWRPTIPLMQLLGLHGALLCLLNPSNQVLYARGRSRLLFVYGAVVGAAAIASFVVGCRWGVLGVAVSWTIVRFGLAPLALAYAAREVGIGTGSVLINVLRPAIAALGAALAVRTVVHVWVAIGGSVGVGLLLLESAAGCASYGFMCVLLLRSTLAKLKESVRFTLRPASP